MKASVFRNPFCLQMVVVNLILLQMQDAVHAMFMLAVLGRPLCFVFVMEFLYRILVVATNAICFAVGVGGLSAFCICCVCYVHVCSMLFYAMCVVFLALAVAKTVFGIFENFVATVCVK